MTFQGFDELAEGGHQAFGTDAVGDMPDLDQGIPDLQALDIPATRQPRTSSRRLTIGLYAAAVFLYWAAQYIFVPTLPLYIQSKGASVVLVGVVLSMYGLWQAIIRLPLGIAADWLGWRKPFIVLGFALVGLGAWIMGTAESAPGLIVGRSITGLAAATWVPLVVAFSALFPPAEAVRASSLLTLVNSAGRVMATGLTGSLNDLGGYSLAFSLATGIAVLALFVIIPAHEERRPSRRPSLAGIGRLITRRDVLLPSSLSTVVQYAVYATTFSFVPILARQLGATNVAQSMLVSLYIGMFTLGSLVATVLANRVSPRLLVSGNFLVISMGIGLAALAPSLAVLFVAQLCIGLAHGTGYPVLMGMSIRYVQDAERTTAMGLHQSLYAIGMFAGPWLSGILVAGLGLRSMFEVTALACLIVGVLGARQLGDN